jgi:hypothetical protein
MRRIAFPVRWLVMKMPRREFLGAIPVSSLTAGCIADYSASRMLDIWEVEGKQSDSTWVANVTARTRNNLEPGGFHDVRVICYSESNEPLCSEKVGNLSIGTDSEQRTVSLECGTRPHAIHIIAKETPCDENTYINFRRFNESKEVWQSETRKCGSHMALVELSETTP